ncbi:MAG: MFS transporter [Armatimonadota bacterium]
MPPATLSRSDVQRGLRISTAECLFATVWGVLATGAFQTGFALELGADPVHLGILAGLPAFVGLLQLPASLVLPRFPARKPFVAVASLLGRVLWLPIVLLAWLPADSARIPLFLAAVALSSTLLTITVPAWTSWMSDLVPADSRGRYFGHRNMLAGLATMLVPLPAGWFLDRFPEGSSRVGFLALFAIGVVAALGAFVLILRQPEPKAPTTASATGTSALLVPLRDINFRRFLVFATVLVLGQGIGGQFFVTWQLERDGLHLPYLAVQVLGAVASAAGLLTTKLWGYLSDKYGARPVLAIAGAVVAIAPFLWIFTEPGRDLWNIPVICLLSITAGAGWAAVGLAQFNLLISLSRPEYRPNYVAVFSAVTGLVGGVAPIAGGALMNGLDGFRWSLGPFVVNDFKVVFLISAVLRIVSPWFLRHLADGSGEDAGVVLRRFLNVRSVATLKNVRRLSTPISADQRKVAVEALGASQSALALEELEKELDDLDPEVRKAAARSLGEIGDARAVTELGRRLRDPATGIGEEAAEALARIGSRDATPWLADAINLPDGRVRIAAIRALGTLGDPTAAPHLVAIMDPRHQTRTETACAAFERLVPAMPIADVETSLPTLLTLLDSAHGRGVRFAAATVWERVASLPVGGLAAPLANRLEQETDPAVAARLCMAVARFGWRHPATLAPLCRAIERMPDEGIARTQAILALAEWRLGPDSLYPWLHMDSDQRADRVARLFREGPITRFGKEKLDPILRDYAEGEHHRVVFASRDLTRDPVLATISEWHTLGMVESTLAVLIAEDVAKET